MYKVQFASPSIYLSIEDLISISSIARNGQFVSGIYTSMIEEWFVANTKAKYAIACANATSGLTIAFKACGFKNKKVAIPAFTWPSILYALECTQSIPVFCDINKETWLMEKPIEDVDIISPVDVFGNEVNIYTKQPQIIDAAHGFNIDHLGGRGLVEVVSFSFTKPITGGQGGMILTNDKDIYHEAKELVKLSAKMTEMSAYFIIKEIGNYYPHKTIMRNAVINKYRELIKKSYTEQKIETSSNVSTYSILLESTEVRDRIATEFKRNGIEVKIYYEPLIEGLPNTDWVYSRIISLPVYEDVFKNITEICDIINEA